MNSVKIALTLLILISFQTAFSADSIITINKNIKIPSNESGNFVLEMDSGEEIQIRPIFPEPDDPVKKEIWNKLEMDRWYLARSDNHIIPSDLYSYDIIDEVNTYPYDQVPFTVPNDYTNYDLWHLDSVFCTSAWDDHRAEGDVLLASIDTGCDIFHPDLNSNIYVNPGEDLNGNGIFELEDLNGYDDDGNGKVDDISGWDFFDIDSSNAWEYNYTRINGEDYAQEDPFVYPDIYGHGTLVSGLQAAVTNNGLGLASAGWNIKTMPIRAAGSWIDQNGNLVSMGSPIDFAEGVYFAVNSGARVISISFGGNSENHLYRIALEYADANNVLVVCAAGNSNSENRTYPAGYETTIAVANIDQNNRKAGDSNYGHWVDISAPGVNIWSTHSDNEYHPGEYIQSSGTSISAPIMASIVGLAISANPLLHVNDLKFLIESSVDSLSTINPEYTGKLGAGRINADLMVQSAIHPVWNPENLILDFDDANSTAYLSWDIRQNAANEEDFLCYEIYRNGDLWRMCGSEEYTETIELRGLVEYKVRASYERGRSEFTNPVYIYNVNPANVSPDSSETDLLDPYVGATKLLWRRCSTNDSLKFYDLNPNIDCTYSWKRCCQSTWGTRIQIDDLARLMTLEVLARNTTSEILIIQLFPFINNIPSNQAIITREISDLTDGWNVIDVFTESIILEGDFLISARSTSLSELEIAYQDSTSDQSFYLTNDGWISHPHSIITSASIAYFTDTDHRQVVQSINPFQSIGRREDRLDEDVPFCDYHIFRDDVEIGRTLNNEFSDTLDHLGSSTYRIEAHYFNGHVGDPLLAVVEWQYPDTHFPLVDPSGEFTSLSINTVQINRERYSYPVEIAVFDKDFCVGLKNGSYSDFPSDILLWKGNQTVPNGGYVEGDSIQIKIWDPYNNKELTTFYSSHNNSFTFGSTGESIINVFAYQPDYRGNFSILNPWDGKVLNRAQIENVSVEWNRFIENLPLNKKVDYKLTYQTLIEGVLYKDTVSANENFRTDISLLDLLPVDEWGDTLDVAMWVETETAPDIFSTDTIHVSILPYNSTSPYIGDIPETFDLRNVYPNPFNTQLNIVFDLPEKENVAFSIFNVEGRLIFEQIESYDSGRHRTTYNSENLASGIYFIQMRLGNKIFSRKVVHLK